MNAPPALAEDSASVASPAADGQTADANDSAKNEKTIVVTGVRNSNLNATTDTGSRLGLSVLDTPASVSVIDGDLIRARGDMTVIEAETRAPGIVDNAAPGNGGTSVSARGFSGQGSILQLYDGVRLFPVAGTITFPVDPWNVEKIEILSGPASVLYGQGAIGGAINVTPKSPNTLRTDAEAEIGYGSQNTFHAAGGIGGPISDTLSYRGDVSYRRSDGYVDRGRSNSLALSGALRFAPSSNLAFTLRDDYGHVEPMRYFGTPLVDGKIDKALRHENYNVADADIHYNDNRLALKAEWTIAPDLTFTNDAYRLTSHRLFMDLETYSYNPSTGLIDRQDNTGIRHDETQYGDVGSLKLSKSVLGLQNDFVIGADINKISLLYSDNFASDPQTDSVEPTDFDPGLFYSTVGIVPDYKTKTLQYSFFAEDRLKLTDQLSVVGGIRHEHDNVKRWTIDKTDGAETKVLDKSLQNTTWRLGVVYQPIKTLSLYGQYATAVDPLGTLTTFSVSQEQFRNATGREWEGGVKYQFLGGRGTFTFAGYDIVKKHLLIANPDDLTSTVPLQVGQQSSKGLEASLSMALPYHFSIDANGTVLKARYDSFNAGGVSYSGNRPPGIAQQAANAWLYWTAPNKAEIRAGVRYVGKTYADNANSVPLPGYAVVDASLSYPVRPGLLVDLRLYNIFNKIYGSATTRATQWVLGRPRSVDISLRAAF